MTVKAYQPRRSNNPFENEVFRYLSTVLERSPDTYILFGPVRIDNRELDGLIIGNGFMVALEVKAVHGHVSMAANIPVTVKTDDEEAIRFDDRHEDPYDQAENHWKKLGNFIRNTFGETGFWFVSMLVFESGSTFDVPSTSRDVYSGNSLMVALDEVPVYLDKLSARLTRFELSEAQREGLIKAVIQGSVKLTDSEKYLFAGSENPLREFRPTDPPSTPLPRKLVPVMERTTFLPRVGPGDKFPPRPWYRSPWFLWFAFFFLNPLWTFLMITDRKADCLFRSLATVYLIGQLLVFVELVYVPGSFDILRNVFDGPTAHPGQFETPIPDTPARENTPEPTGATPVQPELGPGLETACTIIWVETPANELVNKNRAMVWEEIIRTRISGSGMTDRQFYEQVLERNPILEADGYVFLDGKTYFLPQCE